MLPDVLGGRIESVLRVRCRVALCDRPYDSILRTLPLIRSGQVSATPSSDSRNLDFIVCCNLTGFPRRQSGIRAPNANVELEKFLFHWRRPFFEYGRKLRRFSRACHILLISIMSSTANTFAPGTGRLVFSRFVSYILRRDVRGLIQDFLVAFQPEIDLLCTLNYATNQPVASGIGRTVVHQSQDSEETELTEIEWCPDFSAAT